MPIKQRAGCVHEGILLVVTFHEYGVESSDAPGGETARPFDQAGKHGQNGGCVAFAGGRFSGCQSDFALRHGEASQ